ncbi:MAG: sugar transferase [Candidatus Xenobiia bacterium LiM19]
MADTIVTKNPLARKQRILILVDSIVILAAILCTYLIRLDFSPDKVLNVMMNGSWQLVLAAVIIHLGLFYIFDLYNFRKLLLHAERLKRIIISVVLSVGLIIVILYFFGNMVRVALLLQIPLIIAAVYTWRELYVRSSLKTLTKHRVLLVGDDNVNRALLTELDSDDPLLEYEVVDHIIPTSQETPRREENDGKPTASVKSPASDSTGSLAEHYTGSLAEHYTGSPAEHSTGSSTEHSTGSSTEHSTGSPAEHYTESLAGDSLEDLVTRQRIDVLVFSPHTLENHTRALLKLKSLGMEIYDSITFYELMTGKVPIFDLRDTTLSYLSGSLPISSYYRNVKRLIDILLSLFGLLISVPFVALSAILLQIESPGPIFFKPERVGENGKPIKLLKLRTMGGKGGGPLFTQTNDQRVTQIGRIVRKFGFDEFPQMFNVLRGDMSLIGPRPIEQVFVDKYSEMTPLYYLRLSIKPGVSGWAQVNQVEYPNSDESQLEKLQYDLFYCSHASLFLDLIIIFKTIKKFFNFGYDNRAARQKKKEVILSEGR